MEARNNCCRVVKRLIKYTMIRIKAPLTSIKPVISMSSCSGELITNHEFWMATLITV